ncbi:MAG: CCA tRNA nucleotidyltransferase [Gemmataceae bacterium]
MTEREFAIECVRTLQQAGFRALWAGGCVRDELLGLAPQDYDIATDARPEQVRKHFRRTLAIGAAFGVIEVIGPRLADGTHHTLEVATFRSDGSYTDGRRPDSVVYSSPEEDARRRDFTINGLFFDPIAEQHLDFVGGRADLQAKVLRAIGDPAARFEEDKLRVLRAVRIATRFNLVIDAATLEAAKRIAPQITVVSAERIAEELRKLLSHPNRSRGAELLEEFGLLEVLFPDLFTSPPALRGEVAVLMRRASTPTAGEGAVAEAVPPPASPGVKTASRGFDSDLSPAEPGERCLESLPSEASFELAFATLLHALGKAQVERIADRLKLSTAEKTRIVWLVANQAALANAAALPLHKLKPLLAHPGAEELVELHRAFGHDVAFAERMLRESSRELLDPPPLVTGEDLIAMGMKPGPAFKRLLDAVRAAQLDERIHSKEDGLRLVRERHPPA